MVRRSRLALPLRPSRARSLRARRTLHRRNRRALPPRRACREPPPLIHEKPLHHRRRAHARARGAPPDRRVDARAVRPMGRLERPRHRRPRQGRARRARSSPASLPCLSRGCAWCLATIRRALRPPADVRQRWIHIATAPSPRSSSAASMRSPFSPNSTSTPWGVADRPNGATHVRLYGATHGC